jgi:hypothetical protein
MRGATDRDYSIQSRAFFSPRLARDNFGHVVVRRSGVTNETVVTPDSNAVTNSGNTRNATWAFAIIMNGDGRISLESCAHHEAAHASRHRRLAGSPETSTRRQRSQRQSTLRPSSSRPATPVQPKKFSKSRLTAASRTISA